MGLFVEKSSEMRPRERMMLHGSSKMMNWELISLIFGVGSPSKTVFEIAKEVESFLSSNKKMPKIETLCKISGVGPAKACQVMACLELSYRFLLGQGEDPVTSPAQLLPHLGFLKHSLQEMMVCVVLDGGNQVVKVSRITIGLANQTQVHAREVFHRVICESGVSVVLAHNHPSGSLKPSEEDLRVTRQLITAGKLLEIPVVDHLILSPSGYVSLKALFPEMFLGRSFLP